MVAALSKRSVDKMRPSTFFLLVCESVILASILAAVLVEPSLWLKPDWPNKALDERTFECPIEGLIHDEGIVLLRVTLDL